MAGEVYIHKRVTVPCNKVLPPLERTRPDYNRAVIRRVVEQYNKFARWTIMLANKPLWSDEEKILFESLLAKIKSKEMSRYRAIHIFRESFPFRSFTNLRYRFRVRTGHKS